MFKHTHTKKDGTLVDNASREIMAQFEKIIVAQTQSQMGESSSSAPFSMDDVYTQVMALKRHGRVHGFGFGATPYISIWSQNQKRDKHNSCVKA
ncbi:hypothetical protein CK203_108885 [Vitis vinifera]|uniref:Uncharacterized protein n=1 Tax=Vitis vinifera TaxID=29760 RepID=A0A438CSS4_VITVI|nr:hypothetical protein CK203_108885 [Vitis vinifera]